MKKKTPRSSRPHQGVLALAIALAVIVVVKIFLLPLLSPSSTEKSVTTSAADQQEILAFERQRLRDSLARVERWAAERKARQWAHEERQRAYDAQRAIWAAEKAERAALRAAQQARYDSLVRSRPQKLAKGAQVDANAADTTQWQRVPGVGRAYAQAIVRYRARLGGFASRHHPICLHCSASYGASHCGESCHLQRAASTSLSQLRSGESHHASSTTHRPFARLGRLAWECGF